MEEKKHNREDHYSYVEQLCRICGLRTQKYSQKQLKKKPRQCVHYTADILKLFHVDITKDGPMYSPTLCDTCQGRLRKFRSEPMTEGMLRSAQRCIATNSHIWCEYQENLSIEQCSVCSHYRSFSKGGKKRKRCRSHETTTRKDYSNLTEGEVAESMPSPHVYETEATPSTSLDVSTDVSSSVETGHSSSVLTTSTPRKKSRHSLLFESNPGPLVSKFVDAATSPLKQHSPAVTESSTSPPKSSISGKGKHRKTKAKTKEEEDDMSKLVHRMLSTSENKTELKIKTKGQPLLFKRIQKPRKKSSQVCSPTRRRRSKELANIRVAISGHDQDAVSRQEESDVRRISTQRAKKIMSTSKKWKRNVKIPKAYALAMKSKLGISRDKFRDLTRMLRSQNVFIENEQAQRKLQKHLLPEDIVTENLDFSFKDDHKQEYTKSVPAVFIDDIKKYVFSLLDQYKKQNLLTWHQGSIPEDEVWVKVGGDHGKGTLKATLQIANIKNPNSKFHTSVFAMAYVPDNVHNLNKLFGRYSQMIDNSQSCTWEGKKIRVFMFGDFHFLADMYGISGASSAHPCLWCLQTKKEMNDQRSQDNPPEPRTLENMEQDHEKFVTDGKSKLHKAKNFHNVIRPPIFHLPVSQTAVPYLHITLGIVKKHHLVLEKHCDEIDKQIAAEIASSSAAAPLTNTHFGNYIREIRHREELEEQKRHRETELVFLDRSLPPDTYTRQERRLEKKIEQLEEDIENAVKPYTSRSGPVGSTLDKALTKHNIVVQAYHGRSFTGNHCNTYIITPSVTKAICRDIVQKTKECTTSSTIRAYVFHLRQQFERLNFLYYRIHREISHSRPIHKSKVMFIQGLIDDYMKFYRLKIENTIFPKLHFLEYHCSEWIGRWGLGMGFHGEQGGELIHSSIGKLENQAQSIRRPEDRLKIIMMSHLSQVNPVLHGHLPSKIPRKQNKK